MLKSKAFIERSTQTFKGRFACNLLIWQFSFNSVLPSRMISVPWADCTHMLRAEVPELEGLNTKEAVWPRNLSLARTMSYCPRPGECLLGGLEGTESDGEQAEGTNN